MNTVMILYCDEQEHFTEAVGTSEHTGIFKAASFFDALYSPLSLVNLCSSYTFASGSPDNIKQWKFPDGGFIQNLSGHNAIINTLAVNTDGVLVSGGNTRFSWCFVCPSVVVSELG